MVLVYFDWRYLTFMDRRIFQIRMSNTDIIFKEQLKEHLNRFPHLWEFVFNEFYPILPLRLAIRNVQNRIRSGNLFTNESDVESDSEQQFMSRSFRPKPRKKVQKKR